MAKANAFEQTHSDDLQTAEAAALKALTAIVSGTSSNSLEVDAQRIEAARVILKVRSDDAPR